MHEWEFYYENGKFFFRNWKSYEKALNFFNTALTIKPKHADCLYHKGLCLAMLGKPDEAYENISHAFCITPHLQINYDNPDLLVTICLILEEHGDYKNALSLCNNAIPRFPSNTEFVKQRSRLQDQLGLAKRKTVEQIRSPLANTAVQTEQKLVRVWPPEPDEIINKPDKKEFDNLESSSQKNDGKSSHSTNTTSKIIPALQVTKSSLPVQNSIFSSRVNREREKNNCQSVHTLGNYFSFYSNKQDEFSAKIWMLKIIDNHNENGIPLKNPELMQRQIEEFSDRIVSLLHPDPECVICVMPKSSKAREPGGIRKVAEKMCEKNFIDGTKVIERIKDRPPYHLGENRDYAKELASLGITDTELIKGKTILLMDDVTTKGNSLKAGKELLISHGAKQVIPFALGKTSK